MENKIVSLEDIIEYYVMGSRLIGFVKEDNKLVTKIFSKEGDTIKHVNTSKEINELIIDHELKFQLEYIISPTGETIKIKKIMLKDNTKRRLSIFIESTGGDIVERNAVDVLLLTRLLCMLDNKKLDIHIHRYNNKKEYKLGNIGCNIVIGNEFKNMPRPEHPGDTNALYIPKGYDGSIKELIKTLRDLLKINKKISYLRIYKIYSEYKRGILLHKNFTLWAMAYTKFYNLSPDKSPLFQLELMANDYNTKVIVNYLMSRYKIECCKKKRKTIPLELINFHPDVGYVIGGSKNKVDLFYNRIKRNYVNSIFVQNTTSKPAYSYILDINRLLPIEEIKKYTNLLVYVINIVNDGNEISIVVNLSKTHKDGMIACFNSTSILENLKTTFNLKSITVEFNPI